MKIIIILSPKNRQNVYIDDEVWAVGANDDEKWDFPNIFKKTKFYEPRERSDS